MTYQLASYNVSTNILYVCKLFAWCSQCWLLVLAEGELIEVETKVLSSIVGSVFDCIFD